MKFELCTIASGSSGNCIYIGTDKYKILVDAGISGKRIAAGLEQIGVEPDEIQGVFITHEHSDHIKGAGIISRKYNWPIYATQGTWDVMLEEKKIGKVSEENIKIVDKGRPMHFSGLEIMPYSIYHDAADPVGYTFCYGQKKMSIATDLGHVDQTIINELKNSHLILLESNHDVRMLQAGGYPYYLKQRILGENGHLSNELAAEALLGVYNENLEHAILGHLSRENNFPDLAYITTKNKLQSNGIEVGKDIKVSVANKDEISEIYRVL
ncbi:MAG TPA: MBL fold metallo-hydrolase [Epulopiscium sp.]|nr:MBL fold metallo-hydrolase [Candidatus Epulonipiscium sp.]